MEDIVQKILYNHHHQAERGWSKIYFAENQECTNNMKSHGLKLSFAFVVFAYLITTSGGKFFVSFVKPKVITVMEIIIMFSKPK